MKTIILAIILVVLTQGLVFSQEYFHHYKYDNAGNRIVREYVNTYVLEKSATATDSTIKESSTDLLGEHSIQLYPNPTKGVMMVQISGLESVSNSQIVVYDLSGRKVFAKTTLAETTQIDISNQAVGTYFLIIEIDGKSSDWKVIKQ